MGDIIKPKHGPEWHIQQRLVQVLVDRGWLVEVMHGNAFQRGIPDLYLFERERGFRWVDVKNPKKYTFTKAQRIKWPIWDRAGLGIWILTGSTQSEYDKLFQPPNWKDYWKSSWEMPTEEELDAAIAALWDEEGDDFDYEILDSSREGDSQISDSSWYDM